MQRRLLMLGCAIALGCDASRASDPTPVVRAPDRLPDLGMARLSDLSLDRPSGGRLLLRYSTIIVNVGSGPFELHGRRAGGGASEMTVLHRVFNDSSGWRDTATAAVMEFGGDGHDHWHVHDLQASELFRIDNGTYLARSAKGGFCFWDNVEYRLTLPSAPAEPAYAESGCGDGASLVTAMGVSIGWGDIYPASLPDQYIEITGLPDGAYRLMVTADPDGWFAESSESNNVTWVDVELSNDGGSLRVLGYGPAAVIARSP